jgi:hypothetical protein
MTEPILPPLKPIPMKDRVSVLFVEKGNLDVLDGAFVIVDKTGVRTRVPRMRGDEPNQCYISDRQELCSPHARG